MAEPTGLIAKSGIELLTFGTPNGVKASILLEELKEAYGTSYAYQSINISKNTQKEPWYTALNPNGRIPTIVDHDRGGFAVFEGLAILAYLARHYDPEHRFSFPVESDDYSVAEQWMAWQHGGLGPMQGQANHFLRAAAEKIPYGIQRYVGEASGCTASWTRWTRACPGTTSRGPGQVHRGQPGGWSNFAGIDLGAWGLDRLLARPAVQKGLAVPGGSVSRIANGNLEKEKWEEGRRVAEEAKEKYGYKDKAFYLPAGRGFWWKAAGGVLDTTELFHNKRINRRLALPDIRAVIDFLRKDGRAEYVSPPSSSSTANSSSAEGGGDIAWIYWRTPEEWAALVEEWVDATGQKGSVLTVYELVEGDGTVGAEFHGLDQELLLKALGVLVKRGKAQVFGQEDSQGVKFF
ncbi:hypothetical protein NEMBOFW57_008456 [Staphylotrichum longicolle]|uniref:ESCRT-II complex subunit VPS25 n=1 Tax=Staphylotrichum longicolle TaxID=669026 RepID=A0AAD4ERB4_9PEZI|nr:hypothetical protein NEMBOFW57_008456 [Staphylotrichum longicolle]